MSSGTSGRVVPAGQDCEIVQQDIANWISVFVEKPLKFRIGMVVLPVIQIPLKLSGHIALLNLEEM